MNTRLKLTTGVIGAAMVVAVAAAGLAQAQSEPESQAPMAGHEMMGHMSQGDQGDDDGGMMAQCQKMMDHRKELDARLDALVEQMSSARGEAKVDAVAAVLAELVAQRKSLSGEMGTMMAMGCMGQGSGGMHAMMGSMSHGMAGGMMHGAMMQGGEASDTSEQATAKKGGCPMMQGSQSAPGEAATVDPHAAHHQH